jgi:putative ABC transport system permease protein
MISETALIRTTKLGVKNLLLHKLRSFLTVLGMMLGVASVITMLAVGEGAAWEQEQQIKAMGSDQILLESVKPADNESSSGSSRQAQIYGLTDIDREAIASTLPGVRSIIGERDFPKHVSYRDKTIQAFAVGTTPEYAELTKVRVSEGRFIVPYDDNRRRNVAVFGDQIARELFRLDNPIGKTVRIGGEAFDVVGVLAHPETSAGGSAVTLARQRIFIPLHAANRIFGKTIVKASQGSREFEQVELHRIRLVVDGTDAVVPTAWALRALMDKLHAGKKDYNIVVPLELLRQKEETARLWNLVLGTIAGISLLIGGIGIMNVMLATVTERTREIGIRRALGAKRKHIVAQFLVETTVLSCFGGLVGILLGVLLPELAAQALKQKTIVEPFFAILAFVISGGVGIVAGLYPAWRAAQMDPVDALRHE